MTTNRKDPRPADVAAHAGVTAAQWLLPCADLAANLDFFVQDLGMRVEAIFPADDPRSAIVSGHGLQICLLRGEQSVQAACIELLCEQLPDAGPREWQAPNGTRVRLVAADPALKLPPMQPSLAISQDGQDALWHVGRAGLRYRDLIPDRHGGAYIASHIRLLEGGPVADYVHFHKVRFQTIFCRKGWVRVVYEDQGPPFVMNAGDCVLQPPLIRHRVLESSPGAEVVEITAPAEHITRADPGLDLPNTTINPTRDFSGQRFVRHVAAESQWMAWCLPGFECRDTGIGEATRGLAGVRVVRATGDVSTPLQRHGNEFCFYFVLDGSVEIEVDGKRHALSADASISIPGEAPHRFTAAKGLQLLEVTLPA